MARQGKSATKLAVKAPVRDDDDNLRDSVIMFVDIVGASEVSNYLSPADYKDFVKQFQDIFLAVCADYMATRFADVAARDRLYSARGDEGILMIYPKAGRDRISLHIDSCVLIALELKRRWLLSAINRRSIAAGIVPIDLAIGIHVGQVYLSDVVENGKPVRRPEGYAINLAKRVESFSRTGHYTHIFVSETAHGFLNRLTDEKAYIFDEPKSMAAKGFSRDIRAFEIMHHFLPITWAVDVAKGRDPVQLRILPRLDLEIVLRAHRLNPTNVWLAEEAIRSTMLVEYSALSKAERTAPARLRDAFRVPLEIISYLEQGDQRDPGILVIKAHLHGDCMDFAEEQRCYIEAKDFDRFVPVLDWYHARSLSREVWVEIDGDRLSDAAIEKLTPANVTPRKGSRMSAASLRDKIREAGALLERSTQTARWAAWIQYAYGCELIKWSDTDEARAKGIDEIATACELLDEVRVAAAEEKFLTKARADARLKALTAKRR